MTVALWMAWHSVRHAWGRSLLIAACLAIALSLPIGGRVVSERIATSLTTRASAVPLVIGARGSRFDLVFNALYHRKADLDPVPYQTYTDLLGEPDAIAIPVVTRATARGTPVVSASIELFDELDLKLARGRRFAAVGECVLGAQTAASLGLEPGDTITTDATLAYDITQAPTIELRVVGILQPTASPDDDALFTDIETAWLIDGFAHGHQPADTIKDQRLLLGTLQDHVVISQAAPTHQTITADNASDFHLHGSRDDLPLSSILVFPRTDKARTIIASRVSATDTLQAVRPADVASEVLGFLARARAAADLVGLLLLGVTLTLATLIIALVTRLREAELRTLRDIGAPPRLVAMTLALESGILILAAFTAAAGIAGSLAFAADTLLRNL